MWVRRDFSSGFFGMFQWHKDLPMAFNIYSKATGKPVKLNIKGQDAAMCFHVANCFESEAEKEITLDITWSNGIFQPFTADASEAPTKMGIMRYTIDIEKG